jgi:hypothetical protein
MARMRVLARWSKKARECRRLDTTRRANQTQGIRVPKETSDERIEIGGPVGTGSISILGVKKISEPRDSIPSNPPALS